MRNTLSVWLLFSACFPVLAAAGEANPEKEAIEKCIASYVAAFNQADAKALAAHWTEQGEYVSPSDQRSQGQKQLAENFAAYFAETKNAKLELVGTQVEVQSPSVAFEEGTARILVPEKEPMETTYRAIHVKTAAGWKIDSIREQEPETPPPSHGEQLQPLAWMVGQWSDADEKANIETNCRWSSNKNFLVHTFKVFVKDRLDFEGTQIIGWDPHAQAIRSWTFDSDGGFGAGVWSNSGNRWTVKTLNVLPDGRRGTATNIYELKDASTVTYRSIGRQVDGELLPSVDPVTIVRAK